MLRSSIAALGPSLFGIRESPSRLTVAPAELEAPRLEMGRIERLAVLGLGIAGVLPPLAFTARPGDLGAIAAVPLSVVLTGLLIFAPALVGLVAALSGIESVRESFRLRGDREHEQAVLRVFAAAAAVAYAFCTDASGMPGEPATACEIVAALGLAGAWGLLALTILDPVASTLRRHLGLVYDAALLSAFLHFGGRLGAPWVPLYLLCDFYAGFRFGFAALAVAALCGVAGFALVVATTPFWHQQPLLAAGFALALTLLPAYVGAMVRMLARSQQSAATAQAARTRFLTVISQALRAPLDELIEREPASPAAAPFARGLQSQLSNVLDFAAIEAGVFVPQDEAFDLHRLVNDTLADRRAETAARGRRLRVHIDPALPYRLRGWPKQLAQVLENLMPRGRETGVRIVIDAAGVRDGRLWLRLTVSDDSLPASLAEAEAVLRPVEGAAPPAGGAVHDAFRVAVAKRLIDLMRGTIAFGPTGARGRALTVTLPFELDEPAFGGPLDLAECLVLIASEDGQFVSEIAEPLHAWHGDPRWIDGFGGTIGFLDDRAGSCSVLVVDGRSHVLAALTFAHRAATAPSPPSFIVAVADPAQIDGFLELSDGEVDAVLAAPLDAQLLANALHSLPLWRSPPARPVVVPEGPAGEPAPAAAPQPLYRAPAAQPSADPQVTPISAHPRFGGESVVVDVQALAALRRLGGGEAFLEEVIETFRGDAAEIMQRIERAAAMADTAAFGRGLQALRSCAANLGGLRLCEVIQSLRTVGVAELREQGTGLARRLADELVRLEAALAEHLPEPGRRRS
ncbi:MAG: hypothetical protein JO032_00905 [Alphaproteobacteria bacterium]|nr:hypothetical protein [Alphaproteobacteria bacterium]